VQRTFTKRLSGLRSLPYNERLSLLSIDRLELRRIRADLVMCYKIIYGLVDIPFDAFSSSVLITLPVAILLNYIIPIPESMHVPIVPSSYCYIMESFASCYSSLLSCSLQSFKKSLLKVLILIMLCLVNTSLCCICLGGFNLCFICLFRPICV